MLAAAKSAVVSREAQTTQANLETIVKAVEKLNTTVTGYKGGVLAAVGISSDEATLGQDIKNSTADAKKSEVVTDEEAKILIAYIENSLVPSIEKCMASLKAKKTELAAAGLGDTVLGDLKDLRASSNALGEALVEKAPATQHEAARAANAKVDAHFDDAIKFFGTA
jgi:hypothetical protein